MSVLLDASAWPLLYGYRGVEYRFFYFQLAAKFLVYPAIKLRPIGCYNQLGYSEPAHNVFPYKLNNLFIFDGCEGFNLCPFAKVVGGNQ